ncbi:MAG TPA: hypothetical protein VNF73_11990 [Candidatus Saccharimonadales bacterium]|nr:hypothetical protein [Candidatus Saccharimonadales bacterium]
MRYRSLLALVVVVVAATLGGCIGAGARPGSDAPTGSRPSALTASPSTTVPPIATEDGGSASPPPDVAVVTIGPGDAGSTVVVGHGANVFVRLGTDLNWRVSVSDSTILQRAPGVLLVRGAQGLYRANQAGRATITAVGEPACRLSQPPCMAPSRTLTVTVVVR